MNAAFRREQLFQNRFSWSSKVCFSVWILLCISLLFCFTASAEIYGQFVGWRTCRECHEDIYERWQKTGHAAAFESLKNSNRQDLPDCIQCHVVGYDQSGGFLDWELTAELAGVQCECCHGPGKTHIMTPEESGNILKVPSEEICRKCHAPDQDSHFDYSEKKKTVH